MPLNVYKCEDKHITEVLQKFSDKPLEKCPNCGKPLKKVVTSTSFRFKQP